MGLNFRKRLRLTDFFSINLSGSGVSVSAGIPGLHVNVSKKGIGLTAGVPGTGVSYTKSVGLKSLKSILKKDPPDMKGCKIIDSTAKVKQEEAFYQNPPKSYPPPK
jgi:hypothetical protein